MKFKNAIVAATLLLSITSAQAALVETDWKNTGDALATLDTETGIEWLDFSQTTNMSINQAEALTGAGNAFDGWRLPTRAEVTQMMENAFPSQASRVPSGGAWGVDRATTDKEANGFRSLFGRNYVTSTYDYSRGMFKNDPGQSSGVIYSGVGDRRSDNHVTLYSNANLTSDLNYSNAAFSVFLVSDGGTTLSSQQDPSINTNNANAPINDVSAPALLGLMSLGLFGFTVRRRSSTTNLNK